MPDWQEPDRPAENPRSAAEEKPRVLEPTEARQAVKVGSMRYVLLASLILAVIVVVVVGALWHGAS